MKSSRLIPSAFSRTFVKSRPIHYSRQFRIMSTSAASQLSPAQKIIVDGVLSLFNGTFSKETLQEWDDNATFHDPLVTAEGRKQYEAQWYGLKAAFSEIERLHSEVKSAGNPIILDLKQRYVLKGINKEQVVSSVVEIKTTEDGSKILGVKDKWDGEIADGVIKNAFRKLNAVTTPLLVSVPKDGAEEKK